MLWFITTVLVATGSVLTADINNDNHEECGITTPQGHGYIIGGKHVEAGEIPWHAGIYTKITKPFKPICAGSIVTTAAIITAAHCFWKYGEGKQATGQYSVAVGKIYRPWGDNNDVGAQFSNVTEIHIPNTYRDYKTNYENDIAIIILETAIVYNNPYIRPICLSFDPELKKRQLMPGNLGKFAGWSPPHDKRPLAGVLRVEELPFIAHDKCYEESPPNFREYITDDKFCAKFQNSTALCQGNAGGGLTFPEHDRGVQRYYLRGILSTATSTGEQDCDPFQLNTFTELIKHESWIKTVLSTKDL